VSGRASVRERLAAGPKRGLGEANSIAAQAARDEKTLAELVAALKDDRAAVVSRAANALKKVQQMRPEALQPHAKRILRAAMASQELRARWNLTVAVGGLELRGRDRALAVELMFDALRSESAFLRTFAMQGLWELAKGDSALMQRVRPMVQEFATTGTAAMRARARKLLADNRGQH
jgi:hypothetical protein